MTLPFGINTGMIIGVLVVIILALVIVITIQSTRKYAQKRQAEAIELGFYPTERGDIQPLLKKIGGINPRYKKSGLQLKHVYQRQIAEGMLYLFDLWDTGGEDSSELLSYAFLLVRQGSALPAFVITILPDTGQIPAVLVKFMEKLNLWMVDRSLPKVELPVEYGVSERVMVTSDDPARMVQFLDQSILARMSASVGMTLAGKGDSILYSCMKLPVDKNQNETPTLARRYNVALDAFRGILQHAD